LMEKLLFSTPFLVKGDSPSIPELLTLLNDQGLVEG
jgi:hypothetical protein